MFSWIAKENPYLIVWSKDILHDYEETNEGWLAVVEAKGTVQRWVLVQWPKDSEHQEQVNLVSEKKHVNECGVLITWIWIVQARDTCIGVKENINPPYLNSL